MYKRLPNIEVNLSQTRSQTANTEVPFKNTVICKAPTGPIGEFTRLTSYNQAINLFGVGDATTPVMYAIQEILKSYSYINVIRVASDAAAYGTVTINLKKEDGTDYDPVIPVLKATTDYKTGIYNGDDIGLIYEPTRTRISLAGTVNGARVSTPLEILDLSTATADLVSVVLDRLVSVWNTFDTGLTIENLFVNKTNADQSILPTDRVSGIVQLGDSGNTDTIDFATVGQAMMLIEDPKIEKQDVIVAPEFRDQSTVNYGLHIKNKFFYITCATGTTLTEKTDAITLYEESDCGVCYIPSKCTFADPTIIVPFEMAALYAWAKSYGVSKYLAPAGTTRTAMPIVVDVIDNLNDEDATTLYNNKIPVNPVKYITNHGYTLYGQRTMDSSQEFTSKINVSGLVNFINVEATNLLTPYIFEYTPIATFQQVNLDLSKLFDTLVANNAIYNDYKVVCDDSNNTVETLANNELHVAVAVRPLNVAEYIVLDLTVTDEIGGNV